MSVEDKEDKKSVKAEALIELIEGLDDVYPTSLEHEKFKKPVELFREEPGLYSLAYNGTYAVHEVSIDEVAAALRGMLAVL